MLRLFLALVVTNGSLLVASFVLGLWASDEPRGPHAIWRGMHLLFSLMTTMVTLGVHSVAYTYFLATGKWAKEVVRVYQLPEWINVQAKKNKRKAFRFEFWSMVLIAVTAWLGAAADTQGVEPALAPRGGGPDDRVQLRGVRRRVCRDRRAGQAPARGQGAGRSPPRGPLWRRARRLGRAGRSRSLHLTRFGVPLAEECRR